MPDKLALSLLLVQLHANVVSLTEIAASGIRDPIYHLHSQNTTTIGDLTPAGMQQQFLVGKELYTRYNFGNYSADTIQAQARDSNSALQSAIWQLNGIFERGQAIEDVRISVPSSENPPRKHGNFALPMQLQSFAVHSAAIDQDVVLAPDVACPEININQITQLKQMYTSSQISNSILEQIMTNEEINSEQEAVSLIWPIYDSLTQTATHFDYGLYSSGFYTEIYQIITSVYNGLSSEIAWVKINSSGFLRDLIRNFDFAIQNEVQETTQFSLYVTEVPQLISILSVLEIYDKKIPPASSTLLFELRQNDMAHKIHFVVILYNGSTVYLPHWRSSNCTYSEFKNYIQQLEVANLKTLCFGEEEVHEQITIGIIEDWVFAIISILLVVIFIVILLAYVTFNMFKQQKANPNSPRYAGFEEVESSQELGEDEEQIQDVLDEPSFDYQNEIQDLGKASKS